MKAVKHVIVKTPSEYNNEVELSTGTKIVVNTTIENVSNINREVEIVSAPKGTILQDGDKLIIHHNILRRKNDVSGNEIRSPYWIQDDIYFVPPTEIFLYKRKDIWEAPDPFVFIKPIKKTPEKTNSGIYLETGSQTKYVKNTGIITYINKELSNWGLKVGDKVFFKNDSEYEFSIEGEFLYRMKTSDILGLF